MLEMILLLCAACGLVILAVNQDRKTHNWFYVVDNLSIDVCRRFNDLAEAKTMYDLCVADGHEVYLKRLRGQL